MKLASAKQPFLHRWEVRLVAQSPIGMVKYPLKGEVDSPKRETHVLYYCSFWVSLCVESFQKYEKKTFELEIVARKT